VIPDLAATPHRRRNALTGEWVLVSPSRTLRPWRGHQAVPAKPFVLTYDMTCYLCPGNLRAGGVRNASYPQTFVFDNDFPALLPDTSENRRDQDGLMVSEATRGICRVICYSPRHDHHLATMTEAGVAQVVRVWVDQTAELSALPWVSHVQIFENRGDLMGASNPHPHGQIWATSSLPLELTREDEQQQAYRNRYGSCLLCEYLSAEVGQQQRVVEQNQHFVAVVPYWAIWPFETLVLPRAHRAALPDLSGAEQAALAAIVQNLVRRYDRLFGVPFPYSMGFHQQPVGPPRPSWHLHAHYYPPLLRSATIQKFMVGYEMLAEPQRDLTPEEAAERLRAAA
jgi:UDPglucose--hexose-1-phosphate uridylyltransferase